MKQKTNARCANACPGVSAEGESVSFRHSHVGWRNHGILGASFVAQTSPTQKRLPVMTEAKYGLLATLSV